MAVVDGIGVVGHRLEAVGTQGSPSSVHVGGLEDLAVVGPAHLVEILGGDVRPRERPRHAGEEVRAVEGRDVVQDEAAAQHVADGGLRPKVARGGVVVPDELGEVGAVGRGGRHAVAGDVHLDLDAVHPGLLVEEGLPAVDVALSTRETTGDHGASVLTRGVELLHHGGEQLHLAKALGLSALDQRQHLLDPGLVPGVTQLLSAIARRWLLSGISVGVATVGTGLAVGLAVGLTGLARGGVVGAGIVISAGGEQAQRRRQGREGKQRLNSACHGQSLRAHSFTPRYSSRIRLAASASF